MADEEQTKQEEAKEEQEQASEEQQEEQSSEEKTEEGGGEEQTDDSSSDDTASDDSSESEEGEDVEVPEKFQALVEQIENMSVIELNELVKLLEKKFGVSAVAAAAPAAGGEAGGEEEQDEFDVELTSDGGNKIPVMKAVKEMLGLGLKEAKELVEGAPSVLKEAAAKEEADEMKSKVEEAGGEITLK